MIEECPYCKNRFKRLITHIHYKHPEKKKQWVIERVIEETMKAMSPVFDSLPPKDYLVFLKFGKALSERLNEMQ